MKKLSFLLCLLSWSVIGQINTEIHVYDIIQEGNLVKLQNGVNISNNKGYDNQPSFFNNNQVLYAYSRNGATDIVLYDLKSKTQKFLSQTPNGGEYSPQRIPGTDDVSAVRLDDNGYQRFYGYNSASGKNKELIQNLKVAYPTWYDKSTVVASVIVSEKLELFICDLAKNECISVAKNVGRLVKKIPGSNLVSFVSQNEKKEWLLNSFNPISKSIKTITNLGETQDVAWLPDGTLLFPRGNRIYKLHPQKEKVPTLWWGFTNEDINNISRMSVNQSGTKIALTAEVSPRYLAQEQLDAYNNRDIDAFLKPFASNVKVYRYPNSLSYEGIDNMRKRYEPFFKNTPDLNCKLLKRIVYKNQVIDHELVTINGRQINAVAIYTMKNGKITTVTFL